MAVGARTGRDGIHGATFASEELTEETEANRPQVQVGDPFTEKLLLEASLELIRSGHIVGIQDMGAAGLASSSTEMAARSGTGVDIDTALVPVREEDMTPYEILLSESQERMLVVAKAGHEEDVIRILREVGAGGGGHRPRHGRRHVPRPRERRRRLRAAGRAAGERVPDVHREGAESEEVQRLREWTPAELDTTHTERARRPRAAAAARLAEHRVQALGLQPVRHDGPHEHGRTRRAATPACSASAARTAASPRPWTATAATST
jgi:hypothetical protein